MSTATLNDEILRLQSITNILNGYVMLVLIIFGTVELRRMPNSVFLISTSIGSLVLLWATRFPRSILAITDIDLLVNSPIYCKIRWLLGRWGLNMPVTCVCLSSIACFLITSRNVHYRHFLTVQRACFIVIIFSIIYLIICMPDAIYYKVPGCTASANARFIILTWNNLRLSRFVKRSRFQEQVNQMMVAEFILVLVTATPTFVFNIYQQATQSVRKSDLRLAQENLWSTVGAVINFTMHTGTFYVYVIVSRAYRQNVLTAICWKKRNRILPKHTHTPHEQIVHSLSRRTTR
ncbi:unnamed protein product [Rotaria sordida]|uniref:G-protein coupled receptors family 1 profile domain-containing protein n=1 Tax=Rotaria sordida TaxID=392033 RepID=A0A819A682_9BILA|nr:unnamed protein product [Rotaria sordida]CAF3979267.1 unnamed protein product [Rotaria sordida]